MHPQLRKSLTIFSLACATVILSTAVLAAPAGASRVARGPGGPGSISLSISTPTVRTGHVDTPVSCSQGTRYLARVAQVTVEGQVLTASVRAGDYNGPGSYVGSASVSVVGSTGAALYHATKSGVAMSLTSSGGSYTYHSAGSRGHQVAVSMTWTCS